MTKNELIILFKAGPVFWLIFIGQKTIHVFQSNPLFKALWILYKNMIAFAFLLAVIMDILIKIFL